MGTYFHEGGSEPTDVVCANWGGTKTHGDYPMTAWVLFYSEACINLTISNVLEGRGFSTRPAIDLWQTVLRFSTKAAIRLAISKMVERSTYQASDAVTTMLKLATLAILRPKQLLATYR